ncbi:hypothetical protein [Streptomyces indicus]|uniref:Uncharacterized protein n=1 Tax=Streptomyces indicus TaxID=417292 RepID=A0A1G9DCR7_9ACTN|nr:hypothetical protein [Streptomyces indicus]SDK61630.1 hypothetical protein SAMN05421806_109150 [Streptomyces indicus]
MSQSTALHGLEALDAFEDDLIAQYRAHPVLTDTPRLSDSVFKDLLLQRRFLSLAFTPAYDLAIDLIDDKEGLRIARVILREEYPDGSGNTRSHREDMIEDMLQLGISRAELAASRPTAATLEAVNATFALIADAGGRPDSDLRLLTILRFWGEILVSTEYAQLWHRMGPLLTRDGENRSHFYYPHLVHDAKAHPLASVSLLATSHADRLARRLHALLTAAEPGAAAAAFRAEEQRSLDIKLRFYDQFGAGS